MIVRVLKHKRPAFGKKLASSQIKPTFFFAIDCCVYLSVVGPHSEPHTYRAPYSRVLSLVQNHRVFAVGQDVREHASWEVGCVCGLLALGGGRHIRLGLDEDVWIMNLYSWGHHPV